MKKISKNILQIIFFTIFFGFFWVENTFAEILTITGSNETLSSSQNATLKIDTTTKKISGNIYSKTLGETLNIDQNLTCNRHICRTNASFQSKLIWTIGVDITINIVNLQLHGTINSPFMGRIGDFWGWNIALRNSELHLEINNLIANHSANIKINNTNPANKYELVVSKPGSISERVNSINWEFKNIDLSLVGNYNFSLKEIETGKNLAYNNISVKPWEPSNTILAWDFYAKKFCENNESNISLCPDGKTRKASEITIRDSNNKIVNILLRDAYGNTINQYPLRVEIAHNLRANAMDINSNKISIAPLSLRTKITSYSSEITLPKTNYSFVINSSVPSTEDNPVFIQKIWYQDKEISSIFPNKKILIPQPIAVDISWPNIIYTETVTPIKIKISGNISGNTEIIGRINGNINITGGSNYNNCLSPWKNCFTLTWHWEKIIHLQPNSLVPNNGKLEIFIKNNATIYKAVEKNFSIREPKSENIAVESGIVGANISGDTNATISNDNIRTRLLNLIEKNIAYLKRNIDSWNAQNYKITDWNITFSTDKQGNIRSYISLGGDIIIDEDINFDPSVPVTFIALSRNWSGGNIKISGDVTNINAFLIAEKEISETDGSAKTNQLAIIGSVMASNLCSDENNPECFKNLRKDFDFKNINGNSRKASGFSSNMNKIIIQYNPYIKTNPPPGLENFTE